MNKGIAINGRFLCHRPTGMQRYAIEVSRRFGQGADCIRPAAQLMGVKGHAWEQFYLPTATRGRLLWSPNNTGPLAVRRQICTFHDLIPLEHPEWFNRRFASWYGWLLPRLASWTSHIIAISEFTKQRIVELCRVPAARITVIPNGVDARFHPQPAEAIEHARTELALPSAAYLLYVGSLEPRKNLAGLLAAWRRVHQSIPADVWLVVAGAKGKAGVFAQAGLGEAPPRVHFTGYVDDRLLPALYSGALASVYPSLYEGFGLPPLEAMACGTPAITSNTTSLPEATGGAALLVDPRDPGAIADAIEAVTSDGGLRASLRQRGLAWAGQFSWDHCARRTWEVLASHA
ncbi:MAG: glycosyltransferase family 1 protein [Bryobacteraceae bacterium]